MRPCCWSSAWSMGRGFTGGIRRVMRWMSSSLLCPPLFPLVIAPDAEADDDEDEQSPSFDVRGLAEDALDGRAEEVAGARDDGGPDDAADRLVDQELHRGDARDADDHR